MTPLSSLVTTYSTPSFSTQTSTCIPEGSQQALQKDIPTSVSVSFSSSESLTSSRPEELHGTSSGLVPSSLHNQQSSSTLAHSLGEVTNAVELTGPPQVTHHGLTDRNPNLSDSDLVPQADLPEHFLQSQADDPVELALPSSSSEEIVISSVVSPAGISGSQVVVSISDVPMATFPSSDSLMIMGQDGEECVIVEEECQ